METKEINKANDFDEFLKVIALMMALTIIFALSAMAYLLLREKPKLVSTVKEIHEIVKIDPPKHLYLDLKGVKSGILVRNVYISKYFHEWNKILKVGKQFKLTRQEWILDGVTSYEFPNLHKELKEQ